MLNDEDKKYLDKLVQLHKRRLVIIVSSISVVLFSLVNIGLCVFHLSNFNKMGPLEQLHRYYSAEIVQICLWVFFSFSILALRVKEKRLLKIIDDLTTP